MQGEQELALPDLQRAIELDPTFADAYRSLGNAYYVLERWPEALAAYERYVSLYGAGDSEVNRTIGELQALLR